MIRYACFLVYYPGEKQPQEVGEGSKAVEIEVYHEEGGANYFNHTETKRGIAISIRTISLFKRDGYFTKEFSAMGDGVRRTLLDLTRRNDKKGSKVADLVETRKQEIAEALMNKDSKKLLDLLNIISALSVK